MASLAVFALVSTILAPACLARNVEVEILAPKQLTAALQQETYLAVFWREFTIPSTSFTFSSVSKQKKQDRNLSNDALD